LFDTGLNNFLDISGFHFRHGTYLNDKWLEFNSSSWTSQLDWNISTGRIYYWIQ